MSDDPLLGRQLANFQIERVIGRGGMAQVYYGQDVKLERPVAIKVIDTRYRDNPTYAERFIREARTVATWRHENIIQIYYADDEEDLYYFVMEYIDGSDLGKLIAEYVDQGQLMPQAEVVRIGRTIANALDYAHQQGVIHRDVKPSNVMVASDGRLVLTDFGLALAIEQGSLGEVVGSSHYVAPEQAQRSADAVPQSDLYSLGVILYELLTGRVPFDDPSPTAVALQHITLEPPPPREINPELSPEVEAVLLKALSKSPDDRYQTGQALLEALEESLQISQPVPAGPVEAEKAVLYQEDAGQSEVEESITDEAQEAMPGQAEAAGPSEPAPSPAVKTDTPAPDQPPTESPSVQPPPARTTEELIGQQLDEYRLEALLGQGGMARVYRGLDVRLNRPVAIKVIDTPFRADSDYVRRFEREAQMIAQLDHPHIVTVYRFGEANGLLYLAIQCIEGDSLDLLLAAYQESGDFISPEEASRIVREVCLALDYAHEEGIIHRDVKPANIMLDKKGRAVLTDFGLALLTEMGTRGETFGSPNYIAPEQAISSANVVPQSDIYAVGVILYEMFTGQLPFASGDPLEVAMLHMTEPPRPPRELRPDISPELEAVILKALAKEPEERYPSGAALADALDEALQLKPAAEAAAGAEAASSPEPVEEGASLPVKAASPASPEPVKETASLPVVQDSASSPEPVEAEKAANPLPPIPAAVAASDSQPDQSSVTPGPVSPEAEADLET